MTTKFYSVAQMVRQTSSSKELADEFEKQIAAKTLVRKLFVLRQIKGLSRQEVAEKLGWSRRRACQFESSDDADLRFCDIIAYLSALGLELEIVVSPRDSSAVTLTIPPGGALAVEALQLERQLGDLVNEAYGLTPEEVALMWKTAPPRMP